VDGISVQVVNEPALPYYRMPDIEIEDSAYSTAKRTILLIEDNKEMLQFLSKKLKNKYNVYSTLNGADAIKKLSGLPVVPDLILSDIMMDKMDGFSFVKAISGQDAYKHVPVIFLTAKSTATDRMKGLKHGAIDIVPKPFSFEELNQKIETILANISKQKMAILNTSISNLNQLKNFSPESSPVISQSNFDESSKLFNLTAREREIATLMVKGQTYKEIAKELFISEKTVTKHIQNMFGKAGVSNKVGLINKLIR
jgi:DNA-binding NarL/FixJ family response regulator